VIAMADAEVDACSQWGLAALIHCIAAFITAGFRSGWRKQGEE